MSSETQLLKTLDFPVADITPDGLARPFEVDIQRVSLEAFLGDDDSRNVIANAANKAWEEHLSRGRTVFNRPGVDAPGLVRCLALHERDNTLILGVQPTWFWTMLGTNLQVRSGHWKDHEYMVEAEVHDPADVSSSRLANCLSVNLVIVSGDRPPNVLIQRRAKSAAVGTCPYQCSAAGFVDLQDLASPDAASRAAAREAKEEIGVDIETSSISWIGVGRDTWAYGVGLAGIHFAASEASEIRLTLNEEVESFEWWGFEPEEVLSRWKNLDYWYAFLPLGGFALVRALAHAYGTDAVRRAYERIGRIPRFPRDTMQT